MMWKLFNKLFEWDYIVWEDSYSSGISRIYKSPSGEVYYWKYRIIHCIGHYGEIKLWLTCKPGKYTNPQTAGE